MLTEAENRTLTAVGAGTAMGDLLRRYWHPIAAAADFDDVDIKAVRLFGEDLVLYRDRRGVFGLVARHCPHRRADLSYGFVEECGLRCSYHGWRFDETGACCEQPYDDTVNRGHRFRESTPVGAYPVAEHAGLVWAYLGPQPAPLLPDWEPFSWPNGFKQIVFAEVPCNWLQCQENSIDPVHFEWLHNNWSARLRNSGEAPAPTHLKVDFDEFEYGFRYRRLLQGMTEDNPLWAIGRVCLWPNALFTGNHFEWRVPIDDGHTLSVTWCFSPIPTDRGPYEQKRIPAWTGPITDPDTGRWVTNHIMNQDFVAWVGQGTVADRTQEHLGRSDRGVVALRRRFAADLEAITEGRDPSGLVRDPERNHAIELPVVDREQLTAGISRQELLDQHDFAKRRGYNPYYVFQTGQPPEVRDAYLDAMGIDDH